MISRPDGGVSTKVAWGWPDGVRKTCGLTCPGLPEA